MKIAFSIAALCITALAGLAVSASTQPIAFEPRHTISGADFRIVAAAVAEHRFRDPLEGYEVHIIENETTYEVHFSDPKRPEGYRGSSPNMQEFHIELRKEDLGFIRWVGVR